MKPNLKTTSGQNSKLVMSPQSHSDIGFNESGENSDTVNRNAVTEEDTPQGNSRYSTQSRQKNVVKRFESPISSSVKLRKKKSLKRKAEVDSLIKNTEHSATATEELMDLNSPTEVSAKGSKNGAFNCPKCKEVFNKQHALTNHIKLHNIDDTTCGICGKKLSSASSLDRHMLTHTGEKPFKCKYCPQCFTTNGNMNRHMHIHETKKDTKKYVEGSQKEAASCSIDVDELSKSTTLEDSFQGLDLTSESKAQIGEEFQDLSYMAFSSPKFSLVAKKACDETNVTPDNLNMYQCSICEKVFPCQFALEQHEVFHENASGTTCNACQCHFPSPGLLTEHVLKYHPTQDLSNKPNVAFMAALGLHQNVHSGKMVEDFERLGQSCSFVKETIDETQPSTYKSLSKEKSQDCIPFSKRIIDQKDSDISGEYFEHTKANSENSLVVNSADYKSNIESTEPENSNDFADIPSILLNLAAARGASTTSDEDRNKSTDLDYNCFKEGVKRKKLTHTSGKQQEPCPQCGYTCADKSSMQRHMITHEDERPFRCTKCSSTFTTKSNGERHAKTKHGVSKDELATVIDYNLKASNSDEENACKYCGAIFKSSRSLQHHLRSVNNSCRAKPYICAKCGQGCSTKNNCIRHIQHKHSEFLTADSKIDDFIVLNKGKKETLEEEKEPGSGSEADAGTSNYESNMDTLSSRTSSPMLQQNTEKHCVFNEDDRVKAAESLVCLSEGRQLQHSPIDLSICPLDLSDKKNLWERRETSVINLDSSFDGNISHIPAMPNASNFVPPLSISPDCSTPLNLTFKKLITKDMIPISFPSNVNKAAECSNGTIQCVPNSNINLISAPEANDCDQQPKYKAKCEYCGTTFNHKSNKERHIRNFHPEHSRPRKVKNPLLNSHSDSKKTKVSGSTLSNTTREALLSRVLQHSDSNKQYSDVGELFMSNLVIKEDTESPQGTSDLENVDLASVSSVINTANSPKFANYLTEDIKFTSDTPFNREKQKAEYEEPNGIACHECNKSFRWMSALERHIVTHTGVKNYKCPQCGKGFTTNSNMVRHFTKAACCQDKKHSIDSVSGDASFNSELSIAGFSPATQPNYPEPNQSPTLPESPQAAVPSISELSMDIDQSSNECRICNTTYKTETDLRNHTKELHYDTMQRESVTFRDIVNNWKKNGCAKFKR